MAKKDKKSKKEPKVDSHLDDRPYQIQNLVFSLDTRAVHKVECFICDEQESADDVTERAYAAELFTRGWRYLTSEKFQTIGVACPRCAALPDAERGE